MYSEWLDSGTQTFTPAGNVRAPSKTEICEMVIKAWNDIPEEMIANSFKNCGQTKDTKIEEVTCMKPGRSAEGALNECTKFWDKTAEEFEEEEEEDLVENEVDEDQDPFVIDENDDVIDAD